MCGYDELDIRKIAGEMFTNLALPAGVKVKVDCIDDRNRRLKKGIWAIWEMFQQSQRNIHSPSDHSLISKT